MADRKMRILVVDDANLVRLYYRQILEEAGFEVEEALNGLEALERLLVSPADALIVDINMPQMDGVTFLSALRRQALPLSSIPALVTSTESSAGDIAAARAAGANFYLCQADRARGSRRRHGDVLRRPRNERVPRTVSGGGARTRRAGHRRSSGVGARAWRPREPRWCLSAPFTRSKAAPASSISRRWGARCTPPRMSCRWFAGAIAPVTAALIGDCLACLDQVVQWLDSIEESGELPSGADAAADRLAARFAAGEAAIDGAKIEAPAVGARGAGLCDRRSPFCASRSRCSQSAARDWRAGSRRPGASPPMSFATWGAPTSPNGLPTLLTESLAGPDPTASRAPLKRPWRA